MKKYLQIVFISFCALVFAQYASAATFFISPGSKSLGSGEEFSVDVKINSEGESINAGQATISWPKSVEFEKSSKDNSVFNFWVQEPTLSDSKDSITFTGGTPKGISGAALQIVKLYFKTKSAGNATFSFSNSAITASDGKGTNVLSKTESATFTIGSGAAAPPPPSTGSGEQPAVVNRTATQATGSPQKPNIRVPLYPDQNAWYNHLGQLVALWDIPNDVVSMAVAYDESPNTVPVKVHAELATGINLGDADVGIHYIHVRFKNNIGWSQASHYRLAVDVEPAESFSIGIDSQVSDNPTPKITFKTQDSLSGIAYTLVTVDNVSPIKTQDSELQLPVQKPGKHKVVVKVFDNAGNSRDDSLDFEVLALPTPTIDYLAKSVTQGEAVFASGKSLPDSYIDLIFKKNNVEQLRKEASVDGLGNWSITIQDPLVIGDYVVSATARDKRGATSYESKTAKMKVHAKPILSIGSIDLGWFEVFIIGLLLIVSAGSLGGWYYMSLQKKRLAYNIVAVRDLEKMNVLVINDLDSLERALETQESQIPASVKAEIDSHIEKIRQTIAKINKYVSREIRR